jgi:heme oxygenase
MYLRDIDSYSKNKLLDKASKNSGYMARYNIVKNKLRDLGLKTKQIKD